MADIVLPTALVLGAGFSRWAADLPVVTELFDFHIRPLNDRDASRLSTAKTLKQRWDICNATGHAEQFIKEVLTTGTERQKRNVVWYITRRLSDPFINKILGGWQTLMIDDRRKELVEGIQQARWFIEFVRYASGGILTGVVTPNYDLLVEYALGTNGFNYGQKNEHLLGRGKNPQWPWQGSAPLLTGNLPLAKVHGSVSWAGQNHYTDGRCGLRGDALIVPPIQEKEMPPSLDKVWHLASRILGQAQRVLVFGFAFNPLDKALLNLLSVNGSQVKSVLLVDVQPHLDRAKSVWPTARIQNCPPPPKGTRSLKEWLIMSPL